MVAAMLVICALPALLLWLGVDLDWDAPPTDAPAESPTFLDLVRGALGEGFAHTIFVLLTGGTALLSATLCFAHYTIRRQHLTAVLGIVLFWTGVMSISQAVIIEALGQLPLDFSALLPITRAIARLFTTVLFVGGACVLWFAPPAVRRGLGPLGGVLGVIGAFVLAGLAALATLAVITNFEFEATVHAGRLVKRPWDLPALILLALGAVSVFPALHRRYRSPFSYALWLSMLPYISAELYLIFGSSKMYDASFSVAYTLQFVAFLTLFGGIVIDYVRTSRAEGVLTQAVREREQQLLALVENAGEAIVTVDAGGRIEMWNPAAEALFGWSREEADGRRLSDLARLAHRDTERRDTERRDTEGHDTERVPLLERLLDEAGAIDVEGVHEVTLQNRAGRDFLAEIWVVVTPPRQDRTAQFGPRYTLFMRDVSQRRRMELRLFQIDRLLTMGTLAAGVGHEINNPLSFVLSNAEITRDQLLGFAAAPDAVTEAELREAADALESVTMGAERIATLVRDLRVLSSFQDDDLATISLADAARIAVRMTRHRIRGRARLEEHYDPATPPILANDARLSQVFINLLVNALQALPEGRGEGENCIELRIFGRGGKAVAEVRDNGPGIPPEVRERIFDAFYTTKPRGEGTGLGLAITHQIVEACGGTIELESQPGRGTVFRLIFPPAPSPPSPPSTS